MADKAPLTHTLEATIPAPAAAGTVQDQTIGEAPFAGTVTGVTVVSEAAVTANGTNYRTLRVLNKGQSGAGSTVVASQPLDTPGTDDLTAFDEETIALSGTAANLNVAAGDILAWDETVTGTGLTHAGLKVQVEISRS